MNSPTACFRGGGSPPTLEKLHHLFHKKSRIQCRKPYRGNRNAKLEILLWNERKIEREIRSKQGWDNLFEICPAHPWRETSHLHWQGPTVLLDFKNFYPAILCSCKFPHPGRLAPTKNPSGDALALPGLFRTILHPKRNNPERIGSHHPFCQTDGLRSLPFQISGPLETYLHQPELAIYAEWFDLEIPEALVSEISIAHPLSRRVKSALQTLETLGEETSQRKELKLKINLAATTPKIDSPQNEPSPYGVHAFPSLITSLGRSLLWQASQKLLEHLPHTRLLAANTDGILIGGTDGKEAESTLLALGFGGNHPGAMRIKAEGNEAVILGPNFWWILKDGNLVASNGRGKSQDPAPLVHTYGENEEHKIQTIHLADFRHELNHSSLERKKFPVVVRKEIRRTILKEKVRSKQITLKSLIDLRKRLAS